MATLDRQFTHSIPLQPAYTGVLEIGNTSPIRLIKDEGLISNDEPFFIWRKIGLLTYGFLFM